MNTYPDPVQRAAKEFERAIEKAVQRTIQSFDGQIKSLLADLTKLKAERDEAVALRDAAEAEGLRLLAAQRQSIPAVAAVVAGAEAAAARALAAEAHRDALAAEVEGMRAALKLCVEALSVAHAALPSHDMDRRIAAGQALSDARFALTRKAQP
ncbi:hypothetical protein ASG40_11465 [Methylobacterium sp. Leaf399]|uniref:hypothetical protein n=1 Tax=Methylobacterium sp. Leaf399 TaxID=1736364 RepID=UPI0006FC2F49|nr:hypothetical protein [Methylobacterium sp. Leaf399]KQT08492.1 hypothetical protein ASG40_11465 [Methylobacterium sp. Leaf399]